MTDVLEKARHTIEAHELAAKDAAVLLMVSGGSDSTALAYQGTPCARRAMWDRWPCCT